MSNRVFEREGCDVSIALGDDSTVQESESGVRKVQWYTDHGPLKVDFSETLVAKEL